MNKKKRRHSGRYTPNSTLSRKELDSNSLSVNEEYDEWTNYRDGFRDCYRDFKLIKKTPTRYNTSYEQKRIKRNKKQRKLVKRRITRKKHQKNLQRMPYLNPKG